jgi:hypothetical protein
MSFTGALGGDQAGSTRQKQAALRANERLQDSASGAGRYRSNGFLHQIFLSPDCFAKAQSSDDTRTFERRVTTRRLPHFGFARAKIPNVIRCLKCLSEAQAELAPGLRIGARRNGASHRGRHKKRSCLRFLIRLQRDRRLTLPSLTGNETSGHPDRTAQYCERGGQPIGASRHTARQCLEREDDQRVTCQHRDRLTKLAMHRWLASSHVSIVKARQVVVHERGAVQELQCDSGSVTRRRTGFPACRCDG